MNKQMYLLGVANCETEKDLSFVLEMSANDESLTDEEYTEIYEAINFKVRFWAYKGVQK